MDLKQAERNIRIVSLFSFISIPVSYFIYWMPWTDFHLYRFLPWEFEGLKTGYAEDWWPLVLVIILTEFVYFNRSRVAAILLLVVYSFLQIYSYLFVSGLWWLFSITPTPTFKIIWFCFILIYGLIFIQGIRGTFVYHRIKRQQVSPESDCK